MLRKILCRHKIVKGKFYDKSGNYFFYSKCSKCGALFGLPNMTTEHIEKKFPIPQENNKEK